MNFDDYLQIYEYFLLYDMILQINYYYNYYSNNLPSFLRYINIIF